MHQARFTGQALRKQGKKTCLFLASVKKRNHCVFVPETHFETAQLITTSSEIKKAYLIKNNGNRRR